MPYVILPTITTDIIPNIASSIVDAPNIQPQSYVVTGPAGIQMITRIRPSAAIVLATGYKTRRFFDEVSLMTVDNSVFPRWGH